MSGDIDQWVHMLTGVVDGVADSEAAATEEICRRMEAQIEQARTDGNLPDRMKQLEASVSDLAAKRLALEKECADLALQVQRELEQRQSVVLARVDAARRQSELLEAVAATERASKFFELKFLSMSRAQIDKVRPRIDQRLRETRTRLEASIAAAKKVLEEHEPVLAEAKRRENEHSDLKAEVEALEQQLGRVHDVDPSVLRALRNFSSEQLEYYREEVILARVKDAKLEAARSLRSNVWTRGVP